MKDEFDDNEDKIIDLLLKESLSNKQPINVRENVLYRIPCSFLSEKFCGIVTTILINKTKHALLIDVGVIVKH